MQASAAAVVSYIGYASYSPTKYALRGLADALRNELRGFGIQASPGPRLPHPQHIPTRARARLYLRKSAVYCAQYNI